MESRVPRDICTPMFTAAHTQVSISEWTDKHNVVYTCNGIWFLKGRPRSCWAMVMAQPPTRLQSGRQAGYVPLQSVQDGSTPFQAWSTPFQDRRTPSQQGPFTAGFHRANNPGQSGWSYTVTQSWKSNTITSGTFYSSAASQVLQLTLKGRGIRLYILKEED